MLYMDYFDVLALIKKSVKTNNADLLFKIDITNKYFPNGYKNDAKNKHLDYLMHMFDIKREEWHDKIVFFDSEEQLDYNIVLATVLYAVTIQYR